MGGLSTVAFSWSVVAGWVIRVGGGRDSRLGRGKGKLASTAATLARIITPIDAAKAYLVLRVHKVSIDITIRGDWLQSAIGAAKLGIRGAGVVWSACGVCG